MPPCPICRKPVADEAPTRPFCSARCRLLDLGNWLDERYAVPASDEGPGDGGLDLQGDDAPAEATDRVAKGRPLPPARPPRRRLDD